MTLIELIQLVQWDWRVNRGASLDRARAVLLLTEVRIEQFIYQQIGQRSWLGRMVWYFVRFLGSLFQWRLCNSSIPGTIKIGRGLRLPHPQNIIIAGLAEIGDFCTIYHNVSIAWNGFKPLVPSSPMLGCQVLVGAGAIIIGDVRLGSNTLVGAGAIVTRSVPADSRVINPSSIVSARPPSSEAAIPGSQRHLADPYSIWR